MSNKYRKRILALEREIQQKNLILKNIRMESFVNDLMPLYVHEMNNQLSVLTGNITHIFHYLDEKGGLPHEVETHKQSIIRSFDDLQDLTSFLYSRLRDGESNNLVRLGDLIVHLLDAVKILANINNIMIIIELDKDTNSIMVPDHDTREAFWSILKKTFDSLRFSDRRQRQLIVKSYVNNKEAKIIIQDDGLGLPPDIIENIWDHYYLSKDEKIGTGLSISKDIIESLGGNISVKSEPGEFTSFTITLTSQDDKK